MTSLPVRPPTPASAALLERLGTVAVEMGRAGLRRAFVWAVLGGLVGLVADVLSFMVARRVADGAMPLGHVVFVLVSCAIPVATSAAFALFGAQVGALAAGFRHESEVGALDWLVRRGLLMTLAELPSDVARPTRSQIAAAVKTTSRALLGRPRASWKGPVGLVAHIVHGMLASRFERALSSALPSDAEVPASKEARDEVVERAHGALVAALQEFTNTLLTLQLVGLFVGIVVCALIWYPLGAYVVRLVPW